MRWLDHRETVPAPLRGAIIALGNFDGFHLGHQAVAKEAIDWARREGRPAIIATFDPHPVRFFKPDVPPFRLTTLEQRQELYLDAGATAMLVFHFDGALAGTSAEDFITEILLDRLGAHGVVSGEDFTFGQGAKGDVALLQGFGAERGLASRARAIRRRPHGSSPAPSPCAAWSSMATKEAVKSAIPPPTSRSRSICARITGSMP